MFLLNIVLLLGVLAFVVVVVALFIKGTVSVSVHIWKVLQFTMTASPKDQNAPPSL